MTLAAGHFRETRNGAWVESFLNIIISLVLVVKVGMVGVIIGTLIATTVRTIEFIYHTSKYILERSKWDTVKRIVLLIVEFILIVPVGMYICSKFQVTSYLNWIIMAIIVSIVVAIIVIIINIVVYRKDALAIVDILKRNFSKRREN